MIFNYESFQKLGVEYNHKKSIFLQTVSFRLEKQLPGITNKKNQHWRSLIFCTNLKFEANFSTLLFNDG